MFSRRTFLALSCSLWSLMLLSEVRAEGEVPEIQKLLPSDGEHGDAFGYSVALDGSTAFVGARLDDNSRGAVYVFDYDGITWSETQKLVAFDATEYAECGSSVDVWQDTLVVGCRGDDDNGEGSGSAYVYERIKDGWEFAAKLLPENGQSYASFGEVVGIDQNIIVVANDVIVDGIGVYVFELVGGQWMETASLATSDGEEDDNFGCSIAIDCGTAVIGASNDDDSGTNSGSVYVFEKDSDDTWLEVQKLVASDAWADDYFGSTVSIDDHTLFVTARGEGPSGAIYIFDKVDGVWSERQKVFAPVKGLPPYSFGRSTSLSGTTATLGAPSADDWAGTAYVFEEIGGLWTGVKELRPSDAAEGIRFGWAVAISDEVTLVGARSGINDKGVATGSAYIFDVTTGPEIDLHPQSQVIIRGDPVSFIVSATGEGTLSYQWRKDGVPLFDDDRIDGSRTDTLVIQDLGWADIASYDVVVTDSCCSVNSASASLVVVSTCQPQELAVLAPDGGEDEHDFGWSVSLADDSVIVGSVGAQDDAGLHTGAVYFYEELEGQWEQVAKLSGSEFSALGDAVAIEGDMATAGAPWENEQGAVRVYGRENREWVHVSTIAAADGDPGDQFGNSLAMSGNQVLIGAKWDEPGGSAYLFETSEDGWVQTVKLNGSDVDSNDRFGAAVALRNQTAVVGAPMKGDLGLYAGEAYVFEIVDGAWQETANLVASDTDEYDQFGIAVGVYDSTIFIVGDGAIYLFEKVGDQWQEIDKLETSDGVAVFNSMSVSADTIVIGGADVSVYVFRNTDGVWADDAKLLGEEFSGFGWATSLNNDRAAIGAKGELGHGAVHVFDVACELCEGDTNHDGSVNPLDLATVLGQWGPCVGCAGDLDEDGQVGVIDLIIVLSSWGECP